MNFSNNFREGAAILCHPLQEPLRNLSVSDYDRGNFLCYLKGNLLFTPSVVPLFSGNKEMVVPLKGPEGSYNITKAEELITKQSASTIQKFILDRFVYYAGGGYIFDMNIKPLIVPCKSTRIPRSSITVCIDYSVLEKSYDSTEEPVCKFIMRKLIPYLIMERNNNPAFAKYVFTNNDVFVVKPNFQNELDHKLVSEFLVNKINNDFMRP